MNKLKFEKKYWDLNYDEPDTMDGIGNARDHVRYISSLFKLEGIKIESIADFGFGLGHLFYELIKSLRPKAAFGIEPSKFALEKSNSLFKNLPIELRPDTKNIDLLELSRIKVDKVYDLGICTSVIQYIEDDRLDRVLMTLSKRVRYLYLSVPTDRELKIQRTKFNFHDEFAYSRSKTYYQSTIRPHFTIISNRILESKVFFDQENTPFTEFLYRN